jgi:hypothetical protein
MKALLSKILLAVLSVVVLSSCSQQKELADNSRHTYKYKKVYVGNRIVYRENATEITPREVSPTTETQALTETKAPRTTTNFPEGKIQTKKEKTAQAAPKATTKKGNWFSRTAHRGMRQATDFWLKKNKIEERENSIAEKQATQSINGIFAIIGFILGLLGILGFIGSGFAGIGIGAAIAAIIFSALGLRSEYSTLAYIGLIFSIIVLVALILV